MTSASRGLVWQSWDDVYLVYQPSSTETHVFNDTTTLILKCLGQGELSQEGVKSWTEAALGVGQGELDADEFAFAVGRLEELGLIERSEEPIAI